MTSAVTRPRRVSLRSRAAQRPHADGGLRPLHPNVSVRQPHQEQRLGKHRECFRGDQPGLGEGNHVAESFAGTDRPCPCCCAVARCARTSDRRVLRSRTGLQAGERTDRNLGGSVGPRAGPADLRRLPFPGRGTCLRYGPRRGHHGTAQRLRAAAGRRLGQRASVRSIGPIIAVATGTWCATRRPSSVWMSRTTPRSPWPGIGSRAGVVTVLVHQRGRRAGALPAPW